MKNVGPTLLKNIKNTMSDCHVVERNIHKLFEDYRAEYLPIVIDNFNGMTDEEKNSAVTMHNFYCGLHILATTVGYIDKSVKQWEDSLPKNMTTNLGSFKHRSESDTCSFLKAMCNFSFKDRSGSPEEIRIWLESYGLKSLPLTPFHGSRFNILLHNAAGTYFIADKVRHFLEDTLSSYNRLQSAVLSDLKRPHLLTACCALGLLDKQLTVPLFRLVERKDLSILDLNNFYLNLVKTVHEWLGDAENLLYGKANLIQQKTSKSEK